MKFGLVFSEEKPGAAEQHLWKSTESSSYDRQIARHRFKHRQWYPNRRLFVAHREQVDIRKLIHLLNLSQILIYDMHTRVPQRFDHLLVAAQAFANHDHASDVGSDIDEPVKTAQRTRVPYVERDRLVSRQSVLPTKLKLLGRRHWLKPTRIDANLDEGRVDTASSRFFQHRRARRQKKVRPKISPENAWHPCDPSRLQRDQHDFGTRKQPKHCTP